MRLTLDATVFVSRFRAADVRNGVMMEFLKRCELAGVRLFAPTLLLAEVAGALSRIHGEARFGDIAVTQILAQPRLGFRPIDLKFAEKAARLAARHCLRGADATYLTVAIETRSELVTNDAELRHASTQAKVITPEQWLARHF